MPESRTAEFLHRFALLPPILLALVVLFSLLELRASARPETPPPANNTTAPSPDPVAAQLKAQDQRIDAELQTLKDRASAQQNLIAALTTLTGVYVVILSFAAYFRLQQTREESREAIKRNKEDFDNAQKDYDRRFTESRTRIADLITEVRADIPALHGVGRRLELLLAELDTRLPVDGDWTNPNTYDKLTTDEKEQALVDEMVINSLDIFNVSEDIGSRRTIARLYVRLGQFYFARASSLRRVAAEEKKLGKPPTVGPDEPQSCLCRGTLYLDKAVRVDPTDPVALRARGVILMHTAIWKQEGSGRPDYDPTILAHAKHFIDRSLDKNPNEAGARFARAWLVVRSNPPDLDAAIKDLSAIIDIAADLPAVQRKKFLDFCYLNRANYNARLLKQRTPTPEEKTAAQESIRKDLEEGSNAAKAAGKTATYQTEIRREIGSTGDLELVYVDLKASIDALLAIT